MTAAGGESFAIPDASSLVALVALGLVGLVWAVRRPESVGGPAALRFLHVPAMVYLVAVFGLVAAGAYS